MWLAGLVIADLLFEGLSVDGWRGYLVAVLLLAGPWPLFSTALWLWAKGKKRKPMILGAIGCSVAVPYLLWAFLGFWVVDAESARITINGFWTYLGVGLILSARLLTPLGRHEE